MRITTATTMAMTRMTSWVVCFEKQSNRRRVTTPTAITIATMRMMTITGMMMTCLLALTTMAGMIVSMKSSSGPALRALRSNWLGPQLLSATMTVSMKVMNDSVTVGTFSTLASWIWTIDMIQSVAERCVTKLSLNAAFVVTMLNSVMMKKNAGIPSTKMTDMHLCRNTTSALTIKRKGLVKSSHSNGTQPCITMMLITIMTMRSHTSMDSLIASRSSIIRKLRAAKRTSRPHKLNNLPVNPPRNHPRVRRTKITTLLRTMIC